jgi:hypothetical protein
MIERLANLDLLDRIDTLFLEWHGRSGHGPEEIRKRLREAGFRWFEREHPLFEVGMITAFQ